MGFWGFIKYERVEIADVVLDQLKEFAPSMRARFLEQILSSERSPADSHGLHDDLVRAFLCDFLIFG